MSAPHEFEVYEQKAPSTADSSIPEGLATGSGEDVSEVMDTEGPGGEYPESMGGSLGLGSTAGLGAGLGLGFGASAGGGMGLDGEATNGLGSMTGQGASVKAEAEVCSLSFYSSLTPPISTMASLREL